MKWPGRPVRHSAATERCTSPLPAATWYRSKPKTLKVKDVYRAGQELTSTPVIFQYKEKTMIAATTKDGRIHLLDGAAMGGAAVKSAPYSSAADFTPGALATWQDAAGTRWILAPTAGTGVARCQRSPPRTAR